MYKIILKDVGENRVNKDVETIAGIWIDAESRAIEETSAILGDRNVTYRKTLIDEYLILDGNVLLGSFIIQKID